MHSSCRGRRGTGEGSAKKRNRPGLSVGDTKHGTQRGPERGEGGCPGHGSSPHLRGGWGRNVDDAFLCWGQWGSFPRPGWVRSSAAPHPESGLGKPPQRGKEELEVRGRYALHPSLSAIHPHASPRDAFCAFSMPQTEPAAPEIPLPRPGHPSRRPHWSGPRAAPGPAVPPGSLRESLTFPLRLARLQVRASRFQRHFSFPEARPARLGGHAKQPANLRLREKGEAGSQAYPVLHTHPDIPHGACWATLVPRSPATLCPRRHRRVRIRPAGTPRPGKGKAVEYLKEEDEEEECEKPIRELHSWRTKDEEAGASAGQR